MSVVPKAKLPINKWKLIRFLGDVYHHWSTGVVGTLTIPFTVAAIFWPGIGAKLLWSALAIVALVYAAYRAWEHADAKTADLLFQKTYNYNVLHDAYQANLSELDALKAKLKELMEPQIQFDDRGLVMREQTGSNLGVDFRKLWGNWQVTVRNLGADTTLHNWTTYVIVDGVEYPGEIALVQMSPMSVARGDVKEISVGLGFPQFDLESIRGKQPTFRFQALDTSGEAHLGPVIEARWMDMHGQPIDIK